MFISKINANGKYGVRRIVPKENWPPDNCPWMISPPENCPELFPPG